MAQSSGVKARVKSGEKDTLTFIKDFVDKDSFIETDTLIASLNPLGEVVGEGVVGGFAVINGIQTALFATNPSVLKGSIGVGAAEKIARIVNNAVKTGVPLISVIDTSGARFGEGAEILDGYGKILASCAKAYGVVPTICVIKGSNLGMLSYLTAYSDLTVAFDKSVMATASPLVLASKTKIDVAKVGTASANAETGVVSVIVKSAAELKNTVSAYLELVGEPVIESTDDLNRNCKGLKVGAKTSTLIKEAVDKDSFLELRSDYAPEVVTGLARLGGISVGLVANNPSVGDGRLTCKASLKVCELLTLCQTYGLPVVNLVDCAGAAADLTEENDGLIREVGNLIYSYSQISVAKISLVVGKAIGVGYTAFCSKSICDYSAAWTGTETGALESEAVARLLYGEDIAKAKDKKKAEEKFASAYAKENMSADGVAALGLYDNVVKPEFSRRFLIGIVQTFLSKR